MGIEAPLNMCLYIYKKKEKDVISFVATVCAYIVRNQICTNENERVSHSSSTYQFTSIVAWYDRLKQAKMRRTKIERMTEKNCIYTISKEIWINGMRTSTEMTCAPIAECINTYKIDSSIRELCSYVVFIHRWQRRRSERVEWKEEEAEKKNSQCVYINKLPIRLFRAAHVPWKKKMYLNK